MQAIEMTTPTPPSSKGLQEFLDSVPVDDEPLSPEELAVYRERVAEAERGETVPHADVAARLFGWHKTDLDGAEIYFSAAGVPSLVRIDALKNVSPSALRNELAEWGAELALGNWNAVSDGIIQHALRRLG